MTFKSALIAIKNWIVRFRIELIIIVVAIVLDRTTKLAVNATMNLNQSIVVIPKFFNITYVLNDGAAFSMFAGKTWFFVLTGTIGLIVFGALLFHKKSNAKLYYISLALIFGGTFGNYADRLFNGGKVRDFFHIEYFGLTIFGSDSFAIFNIADMCLVIGTIMFAVYFIFFYKEPEKKPQVTEEAVGSADTGSVVVPPSDDQSDEDLAEEGAVEAAQAANDNDGGGETVE